MKVAGVSLLVIGALLVGGCASRAEPQEVVVTAQGMTYAPALIEVTAGTPVDLTLVNQDALEHDLSVLEIPVESLSEANPMSLEHQMEMGEVAMEPVLHVAAEAGATNQLRFTPTSPGRYEFYCTVPGHKQAGMLGILVVNAP